MRRWHAVVLSLLIGTAVGLGGLWLAWKRLPTSPYVRGLKVAGTTIYPKQDLRGWLERREGNVTAQRVVLVHREQQFDATLAQLGVSIDVDATVKAARKVGHDGSIVRRFRQASRARRGEIDVPIVWRFEPLTAKDHVRQHAEALARDPVDARLDLEAHQKIPDEPGQALDVEATVAELSEVVVGAAKQLDAGKLGGDDPPLLNLISRVVSAEVTQYDLEQIDVTKVLAAFDTKFAPYKKSRSHNVRLGASKLNGTILRPAQIVSFNKQVGQRTEERGFKMAPVIVGDELTQGWGGGTCQVSSTLHGAAIYGGLDIVQRRSHSRPSSYTRLGLDATVSWPQLDLKIRNPFAYPIVIHAFEPEPGTLRVELLGGEEVDDVKYSYGVSRIEGYTRRITVKSWLKDGRAFRKQKGTRGMDVFSNVVVRFRDGREVTKQYYSGYRATPEVYWVAPDYDRGELPELPRWAKGYEGELSADGSDVYATL